MRLTAAVAVAAAGLLAAGLPAAAKTRPATPAAVVRAWSAALDRDDNEAAADLFAKNAVVSQGGLSVVLFSHRIAVLWNSGLPCTGRIVRLTVKKDVADATFVLGNRRSSKCDAPGTRARATFRVRNGKIARWTQLPVRQAPGPLTA
ncbi:MAG TPA: limonene-1,2-epoxide hydrolase family protein [Gaiellaceae bacterium]|jgi:limonene-1,2-epoxide hydrolase